MGRPFCYERNAGTDKIVNNNIIVLFQAIVNDFTLPEEIVGGAGFI